MDEHLRVKVGANVTGYMGAMSKVGNAARKTARILKYASAGLLLASALVGKKFGQTLTETATIARATGEELTALSDKARELGKTTKFTAEQAARGMYDLASAGMTTVQVIEAIEYSMKLAGATGAQLHQSTRLVAASLKQFGMDASETKRITDTFASAITSSQLTMDRLTEAMKYAGTTGAALNWTIEETTAAVAQFADLGLEGSMAGTNTFGKK
ncbi:unnamed protein product [marine sediment metagenome]|uniref:Phage tail tape measure protein domain-containing protein n=1 Tax=marine sediment metagenome TaxID=412755 RepID=X1BES2_9ZZZZ